MSKIKISKINDFIKIKEKELDKNFFQKFSKTEEASINLNLDLKRYQQLKNDFSRFNDEVKLKNQEIEFFVSEQNKLVQEGRQQTEQFDFRIQEIHSLYQKFQELDKEIKKREEKANQVIGRINDFESQFEQQLQGKVDVFMKNYDELVSIRKTSLNKLAEEFEEKFQSGIDKFSREELSRNKKLSERYEELEVDLKDRMDDLITMEKSRLQEEISVLSEETKERLTAFSTDLDKGEDRQNDLFAQKMNLEKEFDDYKVNLKGRIDDLAEVILTGFKEKVNDYQLEIIESLQSKFKILDEKMQEWDHHLGKKEKEIITDIDFKFEAIKESFETYRKTVEEEVGRLNNSQNDLKKEFVQVHEDQLEQMMVRIEEFKSHITELESKSDLKGLQLKEVEDFLEQAKTTVTHKLDIFGQFIEEHKHQGDEIYQKNYQLLTSAYEDMKEKLDNTLGQLPVIENTMKNLELEWKSRMEVDFKNMQKDLGSEFEKVDKIQIEFKDLIKKSKEQFNTIDHRLKNEEELQLVRLNKIKQLELEQEDISQEMGVLDKKIEASWEEVTRVSSSWERLDEILNEIESRHLLSVDKHFKDLVSRSDIEFSKFIDHLDHLATEPKITVNASGNTNANTSEVNLSKLDESEYALSIEKQFVELQNKFYQKFEDFIEDLNDEKNKQNTRMNQIVVDFELLVKNKENEIAGLDGLDQEFSQYLEKKKSEFTNKSDIFYQEMESNIQKKVKHFVGLIEKQFGDNLEKKQQNLEELMSAFLESQKLNIVDYENTIKAELEEMFKEKIKQLESNTQEHYTKITEKLDREVKREKEFLSGELNDLEQKIVQRKTIFQELDAMVEKFNAIEDKQKSYLKETKDQLNENKKIFREKFLDEGIADKFFKEIKQEFSTQFLKKEFGKEFEQYRDELIDYTKKWENLFSNLEKNKESFETELLKGKGDMEDLLKKSKLQIDDQENQLTEKFNQTISHIEGEMGDITEQIKLLVEKSQNIDQMFEIQAQFEDSYKDYEGKLNALKDNQSELTEIQKEINEIKAQDSTLKSLYQSIEQKEIMANEVEKKLIQILDLSSDTEERLKKIDYTANSLGNIQQTIEGFRSEVSDIQDKIKEVGDLKENYSDVKNRSDILIDKIENEEKQQSIIYKQLKALEERSVFLENKYKIIDEFTERYDQLDVAVLDIEKRLATIENLKRELSKEKQELEGLKSIFNDQIGVSLSLMDNVDDEIKDKYPEIVKTLSKIGWTEKQIAQHLKLDLTKIRIILKK